MTTSKFYLCLKWNQQETPVQTNKTRVKYLSYQHILQRNATDSIILNVLILSILMLA